MDHEPLMKTKIAAAIALTAVFGAGVAAHAGGPAAPEDLRFNKLLSRLNAASESCVRGLETIQCDYRLTGTMDSESQAPATKPSVKLAVSGKLTFHLPQDRDEEDEDKAPGTFDKFMLEPDTWPILAEALGEEAAQSLKPFPIPGSRLISSAAGSWLVSKDDKTAVTFKMDSAGRELVFGPIAPMVCCQYKARIVKAFGEFQDAVSRNPQLVSLSGRRCVKHLFKIPATKTGTPAGTYSVWLDETNGLPLREELRGGLAEAGGAFRVSYSGFQRFGKGALSPSASKEFEPEGGVQCFLRYAPFESNWFLTRQITGGTSEGRCTMTFSNWHRVTIRDAAFRLPAGAKVVSWDARDKATGESNAVPVAASPPDPVEEGRIEALRKDPKLFDIAGRLAGSTNPQAQELVVKSFQIASNLDRRNIATMVLNTAGSRGVVDAQALRRRAFLLRLVRAAPPPGNQDDDAPLVLRNLARAAGLDLGKEVASEAELRELAPPLNKQGIAWNQIRRWLDEVPPTYEAVWKKLIAALE